MCVRWKTIIRGEMALKKEWNECSLHKKKQLDTCICKFASRQPCTEAFKFPKVLIFSSIICMNIYGYMDVIYMDIQLYIFIYIIYFSKRTFIY